MNYKNKSIIGFALLFVNLVIIKIFFGGLHFDYLSKEIFEELIILLIVSLVLMIIPLIIRLINKKRISNKKGKLICFINSLIIFIICSIPNLLTIIENKPTSDYLSFDKLLFAKLLIFIFAILAIIYYFINVCFFVSNKENCTCNNK